MVKSRLYLVSPMKAHMKDETTIEMLAFKDPVCTWCWGSDPCYHKLQAYYCDAFISGTSWISELLPPITSAHDGSLISDCGRARSWGRHWRTRCFSAFSHPESGGCA